MKERIGKGPWARLLASAVLPDEGSSLAERGRALVRLGAVRDLVVTTSNVTGSVGGCDVTIGAEPVPPRIWAAMTRSARGNGPLEAAVEGREQSVRLEYLMTADWDQPLVPPHDARSHATAPADGRAGASTSPRSPTHSRRRSIATRRSCSAGAAVRRRRRRPNRRWPMPQQSYPRTRGRPGRYRRHARCGRFPREQC